MGVLENLVATGITQHDALVIADCITSRKSCSWVNTDEVTDKMMNALKEVIVKNNYKIIVKIQAVPTRNKYIWEVKVQ